MILRMLFLALALSGSALAQEIKSEDLVTTLENSYEKAADKAGACVVALKVDREPIAAPKGPPASGIRSRYGIPEADVYAIAHACWCSSVVVGASAAIHSTFVIVS